MFLRVAATPALPCCGPSCTVCAFQGGGPFLKSCLGLATGTFHRVRFSQRLMGSGTQMSRASDTLSVPFLATPPSPLGRGSSFVPVFHGKAFVVLDWHTSAPNTRAGGSHLGAWCCLSSLRGVLCGFLLATCPLRGRCCATSFSLSLPASPTCTLGRGLRLSAFVVAGFRQRCSWHTVWPAS